MNARRHVRHHALLILLVGFAVTAVTHRADGYFLYEGDGSDEPGFVPPKQGRPPPPPPAHISSAETYIPYPPPPVTPQARTEKKKPPTPPVLFTKLTSRHGRLDWNTRPNDLNDLLKAMKGMLDVDFAAEVKPLRQVDTDPERNPVLYRSGHFHFTFTPTERGRLREYMLNGGTLILNAGMGSKPFYDSARRELELMFPEVPVRRLGPDHPVFHAYYDLDQVAYQPGVPQAGERDSTPWFDGVTVNCRTVAFISRWGMAAGWEGEDDADLLGYQPESARQLGVNLMAYATAQRAWARNAARAMEFLDADDRAASKMHLAQVVYDGEWKTRHAGLSLLLQQFNHKTDVPVRFARREIGLSDASLFDMPLLYLTGHEDFRLTPEEIGNLRRYLQGGGLLIAEACCGRQAFHAAFGREMQRVLPGRPLEPVPAGHMLFRLPNRVGELTATPALASLLGGKSTVPPRILGIDVGGHYAVLYSPYALAGGWEMSQCPYARGYENSDALRLGENLLMYALTF